MKYLFVLCCVLAVALSHPTEEQYTDKYDHTNLQEILENDRLLQAYMNCILEKGKCTPEGKELQGHIHDAMGNGCKKCTKAQQEGVITVTDFLIKHKPDSWREIADKYDPERKYRKKYEERARAHGIDKLY